jgi:hypothetical protein
VSIERIGSHEASVRILVDFYNFYDHLPGSSLEWLQHELNQLVSIALNCHPDADRVDIRLYGGWLQNSVLTAAASELQAVISAGRYFPMKHPLFPRLLRGEVTLATRIFVVPEVEWTDTLKLRRGLPRIRLSRDDSSGKCANPEACPVRMLNKFTKERKKMCPVEGCSVTNEEAFIAIEQKMVDTMIACDVIGSALDKEIAATIVISDDADIVPAVAMAAKISHGKVRLVHSDSRSEHYESILNPLKVPVVIHRPE